MAAYPPDDTPEPLTGEYWYRYVDSWGFDEVPRISLCRLRVLRHTPAGVMLRKYDYGTKERFVLNEARKRYAYPTKELAWGSYKRRKQVHASMLEQQLAATRARTKLVEACLLKPSTALDEEEFIAQLQALEID